MTAKKPSVITPEYTIQNDLWDNLLSQEKPFFDRVLQLAFSELALPHHDFSVSLVFTNDDEIRDLNREYRHQDKPTNVLSFPMFDDFTAMPDIEEALELGDIILGYETITREAAEQDKSLRDHVAHLLLHGFLHLCGYDHMTDAEAQEMEDLEITILQKSGIANPYLDQSS